MAIENSWQAYDAAAGRIRHFALAIPILLFATPHAHVEKGDGVGRPASPFVMGVIPLERPQVSTPAPDLTPVVSVNKIVQNTPPPAEAEPPPLNEKDLLEPGQQTSAIEHHRRVEDRDICSRHGGHRVEFTRGRRLLWFSLYALYTSPRLRESAAIGMWCSGLARTTRSSPTPMGGSARPA